ncbi:MULTISPECIES: hypothetical protein [unclassified Gilliamella]|uniref:hypothetical protein n=1 Tax=unclassified Gilliamella TaxID=2685620 RepID=UPI00080EBC87|nr:MULTISPECIES: hypothetical protein [Gilliamella]MCX8642911.1 hypothetical protein [Gilliamella sp. B3835]MCX8708317.1 hypothetical protein [Gilliamella sp. B3783]MCX8709944.1 hypothetical protein [Gilliamella sp. B3780]MCX8711996.1 hypothetical protein [Gilliamella sp. B3468]MCX8714256.1 hypothetical protein [Gilliamella sp. B3781]
MLDILNFIESYQKHHSVFDRKLALIKQLIIYLDKHDFQGHIDNILPILDQHTGYSEFRIMNDCESNNPNLWIEYQYHGKHIRLSPGDIVITMKK